MRTYRFLVLFVYIFLVGLGLNISGCGGSNLNNPVSDTDMVQEDIVDSGDVIVESETSEDVGNVDEAGDLDVTVTGYEKSGQTGRTSRVNCFS